jgi:hypothetical protein
MRAHAEAARTSSFGISMHVEMPRQPDKNRLFQVLRSPARADTGSA